MELECTALTSNAATLSNQHGFNIHDDATVRDNRGNPTGREIVTQPLVVSMECGNDGSNLRIDYGDTQEVVRALCACAHSVNKTCGVHVHLGRPMANAEQKSKWEPERVRTFLAIGLLIEERIFTLVPPSRHSNRYCTKIRDVFTDQDIKSYYPVGEVLPRKMSNPKRYAWLNLIETKRVGTDARAYRQASEATGTIEVRLLGNTRRFDYIWAWTVLWTKIAAYVAYLPSSLAINHCVLASSLEPEISNVLRFFKSTYGDGEDRAYQDSDGQDGDTSMPARDARGYAMRAPTTVPESRADATSRVANTVVTDDNQLLDDGSAD
jgi:Putative amidoligase enzyme